MSGGFADPVVTALGTLIKQEIKSPNYVPGVSGWAIFKTGSAEFNNLTIRGTFYGTDFIINTSGIFFYSGIPAAGNLIISIAGAAGTDAFTNTYPEGLSFTLNGKSIVVGLTGGAPLIYFVSGLASIVNGAAFQDIILGAGTGQYEFLQWLGAEERTHNDLMLHSLSSSSADGTAVPTWTTQYKDSGNVFHTLLSMISTGLTLNVALAATSTVTVSQLLAAAKNILVGSAVALGDNGVGELQIANATTVPTTNPVGGFDLYANQGVPSVRDPGGNLLGMVRSYSVNSTSDLSSFITETDVPGATVNVVITGSNATVVVMGEFDFQIATSTGVTMVGFLNWNGSDRPEQSVFINGSITDRKTLSRTWRITGVTAGTYVAKLRASSSVSAVNNSVRNTHTGFTVLVIDQ